MSIVEDSIAAARRLADDVDRLRFAAPVTHVYNPLRYAWEAHEAYLRQMHPRGSRVIFLGMNPGPWGMAQTGVPFGEVTAVREFLRIAAPISRPANEHPRRPVEGLACRRHEVSGQRLWGLFQERFGTARNFFREHFVVNYCPLVFMEASARNRTPDKLHPAERRALVEACDQHLQTLLAALKPEWLVGVGQYAEECLQRVTTNMSSAVPSKKAAAQIVRILHPSPASPAANRGWSAAVTKQLVDCGLWKK